MPRNTKGGNKAKKGKNIARFNKRTLILKEEHKDFLQLYGKVKVRYGGKPAILGIIDENGVERRCVVRGKHGKKSWMNTGDIVLINIEIDDNVTGEIAHKYRTEEISQLEKLGHISQTSFKIDNKVEDENIVFETKENKKDDFYTNYTSTERTNGEDRVFIALGDGEEDDDDFTFDDI